MKISEDEGGKANASRADRPQFFLSSNRKVSHVALLLWRSLSSTLPQPTGFL